MLFSNRSLSERLERAEGHAASRFAEARAQLFPASKAQWTTIAGAAAIFDGIDSPVTQSFGLGLFEPLNAGTLTELEQFFLDRGAQIMHEVSPFAGIDTLDLLCSRGYRPIEISSVLYREVEEPGQDSLPVRVIGPEEAQVWADVSARGWSTEHPGLADFFATLGSITTIRKDSACFLAEAEGAPAAAGNLSIHEGVALMGGAATVPEFRRRGLQNALLEARLRFAHEQGCDLAMMVAMAGSDSQRNAERQGFRVAYTRIKWHRP